MSARQRHRHLAQKRIQLTPKQANIFVWGWQPDARWRYAVCGRRFGKTFLGVEEIHRAYRQAVEHNVDPDNEIWYGAPTFKQAKRVFWRRLLRYTPPDWIDGRPNNTECILPMRGGYIIRLVGLDDPDALRGSGLWFFLGDEWDDAKDVIWPEIIRPMLATAGGHALKIGTPKGFGKLYKGYKEGQPGYLEPDDPLYQAALEGRDPFTMSWQYNTLEGGNVPLEEVEQAMRTLDPRTFRQEYKASFETYAGRIYYDFMREDSVRRWEYRPDLPPFVKGDQPGHIYVGMDFNINPMSATLWQEYRHPDDGRVVSHQFDEIIIPTSDTHEMGREIRNRYGRPDFSGNLSVKHITIYPDPAGAGRHTSAQGETDITILRKMGFSVWSMSTHPLVRDRINLVNSRIKSMDERRHMFIDPRCAVSIEAMEKHAYKEGTGDPDKDQKTDRGIGLDHINDATGYYVYTRFAHQKAHGIQMVPHMRR